MRTCIAIVALILAFISPGYTSVGSAQPPCNEVLGDAEISELKSSLTELADLQRQNADTMQFDQANIIKTAQVTKTAQVCLGLFIAPYEIIGVDGGNAVDRYIAVFESTFEDPLISDLREAVHLRRKHFSLTGFYPVGVWGRIDWRRATISNNQVKVPAMSLLCGQYNCCHGGPGFVLIDLSVSNGRVVTNVREEYSGSDDSSQCP